MTRGILESPTKRKHEAFNFMAAEIFNGFGSLVTLRLLTNYLSLRQVNRITCPRRCHEVAVLRSQIICRMGFKKCIRGKQGKTKPWAKKGFRSKKFEDFLRSGASVMMPAYSQQFRLKSSPSSETELRVTSSEVTFTDQRFSWSPLTQLGQGTTELNLILGRVEEI